MKVSANLHVGRFNRNQRGFTLLEVLVAISIFSVVSLASFTIFDTVVLRGIATVTNCVMFEIEVSLHHLSYFC